MKTLIVNVERNKDGFGVYTEQEFFAGMGDTLQSALDNLVEGINLYIEVMREDNRPYPAYLDGGYDFKLKYDMVSMVSYYAGIIGFAGLEKITGIHQKQLGAYAKGESTPRKEQTERFIAGLHTFGTELNAISL